MRSCDQKISKRVKAFSLAGKRLRRPVIFRVQNNYPRMGKVYPADSIWETLRFPNPSVYKMGFSTPSPLKKNF